MSAKTTAEVLHTHVPEFRGHGSKRRLAYLWVGRDGQEPIIIDGRALRRLSSVLADYLGTAQREEG